MKFRKRASDRTWQNTAEATLAVGGAAGGAAVAAIASPYVGLAVGCGALGAAALTRLAVGLRMYFTN